jgi:ABC-type hemin transport system substrate-binding protein
MEILKIEPGPKVGQVLEILLEKVIEDPKKNEENSLKEEIKKLGKLSKGELEKLAKKAKEKIEIIQQKRDEMTKKKYWVT